MRLLVVGAGAAFSTLDVETGYCDALDALGVDIRFYALGKRLDLAREWLHKLWRKRGAIPSERPTNPDMVYRGSVEALEMALRFRVDWVLIISGMFFHPDVVEMLHRANIRTAVILTESPYEDAKQSTLVRLVDMAWTNERTSVERLRLANQQVKYLQHAYDPAHHALVGPILTQWPISKTVKLKGKKTQVLELVDLPAHDVVFVGSGFRERIEVLEAVDWSGVALGLYGEWKLLGSRSKLRQFVRGGAVSNDQAVALYRRAKIGLNLYRTSVGWARKSPRIAGAESMNPRAYELAACGVFQLAERRKEQSDVFGWSIPTFESPEALQTLLQRFLNDPAARQHCVAAALERVERHTFAARAAQVIADLESFDQRRPSPNHREQLAYAGHST